MSLCVFGSVATGTMRHDSDIDLLVVCDSLPRGRTARIRKFEAVDSVCEEALEQARQQGVYTAFSPLIKTPDEVRQGSPVFLDMTVNVRILIDRRGFFMSYLDGLNEKLTELGSRRIQFGGGYYWILKPGLKPDEEIIL